MLVFYLKKIINLNGISKFQEADLHDPHTFKDRINTSGVKTGHVLKKITFISQAENVRLLLSFKGSQAITFSVVFSVLLYLI